MRYVPAFAPALVLLALVAACQATRSAGGRAHPPATLIMANPYDWPPFAACCFYENGVAIEPQRPFAEREREWADWHLRFGKVYLVTGSADVSGVSAAKYVQCVRGRDTMTVFIRPENWKNVVYDSIPFKAGRYYLSLNVPRAKPALQTGPALEKAKSFDAYFQQHEALLASQNPFTGCRFRYTTPPRGWSGSGYVPPAPTEIFRLLLQHRVYLDRTAYTILPLAKGQVPSN